MKMSQLEASRQLVAQGAQFVERAIEDNPDGPVTMQTEIGAADITYDVWCGDVNAGDHGKARLIWRRIVTFGHTDATVAGGRAFQLAARQQELVAWAMVSLVDSENPVEFFVNTSRRAKEAR